jgi:hypothetical protein
MAAVEKFLIDRFVTAPAVAGRQLRRDGETVVFHPGLRGGRLVAVETIDTLLRVPAHLVLVDDRILLPRVALRAFAGRAHECRRRLVRFHPRSRPVDQEGADNQAERDDDRDEDRSKRHALEFYRRCRVAAFIQ